MRVLAVLLSNHSKTCCSFALKRFRKPSLVTGADSDKEAGERYNPLRFRELYEQSRRKSDHLCGRQRSICSSCKSKSRGSLYVTRSLFIAQNEDIHRDLSWTWSAHLYEAEKGFDWAACWKGLLRCRTAYYNEDLPFNCDKCSEVQKHTPRCSTLAIWNHLKNCHPIRGSTEGYYGDKVSFQRTFF